ncbi:MAG: EamA/RhaT family transporter [Burkholderiales bacterium]|nr:EamA/RhaT family transporter [Burkholderiales bacterium]
MLWIPITIGAARAQTVRNATQRHLIASLGTPGATLVRFLYGLPFAALWLYGVHLVGGHSLPALNPAFVGWTLLGALTQVAATALLLRVMAERNFALGVAYSKTEILQVALFGLVFLGDPLAPALLLAIACATLGVLLLSPVDRRRPLRSFVAGWTTRSALLGIACGGCFGVSVVSIRGATLALENTGFMMAATFTLVLTLAVQSLLLGGWLAARDPGIVVRVGRTWRASLFAGLMGAAASVGWFTAFAIEPAAHVRTLGLIELFFSYAVSRRFFRERLTRPELAGMGLLGAGLVIVTLRP